MASNNISNMTNPVVSKCLYDKSMFDVYCLVPAFVIIVVLAFLNQRVRILPNVCNGKPALVLPVNFLGTRNRLSTAIAFGIISNSCYQIFVSLISRVNSPIDKTLDLGSTPWQKAFNSLVLVLVYGMVNYPICACLMTESRMVGAAFGLLYVLMRFIALLVLLFSCPTSYSESVQLFHFSQVFKEKELFTYLPVVLCNFFLLVRFSVLLHAEISKMYYRHGEFTSITERQDNGIIAKAHDFIHVNLLLSNQLNNRSDDPDRSWYTRLRDKLYKPRRDFKYSTGLISTLTVAAFLLYHMTVDGLVWCSWLTVRLEYYHNNARPTKDIILSRVIAGIEVLHINESVYVAFTFTTLFSVMMMLRFVSCHRRNVLTSYKTQQFLNRPSRLVGRSLSYPGYQIAYIAWGYIVILVIVLLSSLCVGVAVMLADKTTFSEVMQMIWRKIIPVFVVPVGAWVFQYFLGFLVFRDRGFPDRTITVDNRRLYCVMSFFFFFFNILVGFFSSCFRIMKSMFLGIFFMSRIDCTPMMVGYQKWDKGYMSYVGFINVLKSFSHPVMLVFCQLLLDRHQPLGNPMDNEHFVGDSLQDQLFDTSAGVVRRRRVFHPASRTVANRWLVAYTLLWNPGLRRLRKHSVRSAFHEVLKSGEEVASLSTQRSINRDV